MPTNDPYDLPPEPTTLEDSEVSPTHDERNLAMLAHLSGCAGILAGGLVGFLGPLVIYLLKKESSIYVENQAKEALNFQITLLLLSFACAILTAVSCGMFFPLLFVPMILQVIYGILATLAVRDGGRYRYPFNLRLFQ